MAPKCLVIEATPRRGHVETLQQFPSSHEPLGRDMFRRCPIVNSKAGFIGVLFDEIRRPTCTEKSLVLSNPSGCLTTDKHESRHGRRFFSGKVNQRAIGWMVSWSRPSNRIRLWMRSARHQRIEGGLMTIVFVRDRSQRRVQVSKVCELRQILANLKPRKGRRDWFEFTANFDRSVWL